MGIGTPSSQSRIERPIWISYCLRISSRLAV